MSIIIENGVVKKCAVSENLIIPEGVTEIADEAFYHNENIKTVVLPNGIKRIGNRAFMQCYKLEKINLPDSITEIGEDAFHECLNLKKIKLPDGIKRIERGVFRGCVTLNEIDIPKTVEVIEPYAFINVPWLKNLIDIERNSETNMVILGDNILYRYVGEKSHVCIPDNIKSVAERAFSGAIPLPKDAPKNLIQLLKRVILKQLGVVDGTIANAAAAPSSQEYDALEGKYKICAAKLDEMNDRLLSGYTGFWR